MMRESRSDLGAATRARSLEGPRVVARLARDQPRFARHRLFDPLHRRSDAGLADRHCVHVGRVNDVRLRDRTSARPIRRTQRRAFSAVCSWRSPASASRRSRRFTSGSGTGANLRDRIRHSRTRARSRCADDFRRRHREATSVRRPRCARSMRRPPRAASAPVWHRLDATATEPRPSAAEAASLAAARYDVRDGRRRAAALARRRSRRSLAVVQSAWAGCSTRAFARRDTTSWSGRRRHRASARSSKRLRALGDMVIVDGASTASRRWRA